MELTATTQTQTPSLALQNRLNEKPPPSPPSPHGVDSQVVENGPFGLELQMVKIVFGLLP